MIDTICRSFVNRDNRFNSILFHLQDEMFGDSLQLLTLTSSYHRAMSHGKSMKFKDHNKNIEDTKEKYLLSIDETCCKSVLNVID